MPSSPVLLQGCMLPCFYTFWHYHPYILQHLIKMFSLHLFHWFLLWYIYIATKMCINIKNIFYLLTCPSRVDSNCQWLLHPVYYIWVSMWEKLRGIWRQEHKYAVRTADQKNGIAVHVQKENHRIDWENAKVKEVVPQYWKWRTVEVLEIKSAAHTMNLDCGLTLSSIWDTLRFEFFIIYNIWYLTIIYH